MMVDEEDGAPPRFAVSVDGREIAVAAPIVTGREIAELAGVASGGPHMLVRVGGGRAAMVPPDDSVILDVGVPVLRSGPVAVPWTLSVDGEPWDWPAPAILADEVRDVAGLTVGCDLFVGDAGEPVRAGGLIDLTAGPPEVSTFAPQLPARPAEPAPRRSVPVIVNGRPRELADPDATFEDLVRLAFPQLPARAERTFTVTYRRGAAGKPEGSLVPHQAARLAPGAVINVSATDRS